MREKLVRKRVCGGGQRIEMLGFAGRKLHRARREIVIELRQRTCADDGAAHAIAIHDPAQRDLRGGHRMRCGDLRESIEQDECVFIEKFGIALHARGTIVGGMMLAREFAREHPATQRTPRCDSHS